ncbi:MAG: hypothetical protein ACLGI5_13420 [Thermoleophilia bacterium]
MHPRTRTTAAAPAIIALRLPPGAATAGGWATVAIGALALDRRDRGARARPSRPGALALAVLARPRQPVERRELDALVAFLPATTRR